MTEVKVHKIDAKNKVLGRLSTEIAVILMGKDKPEFVYNNVCGDKVVVVNAEKIVLTGRKLEQKTYYSHSGHLGNLKEESAKHLLERRPTELIKRAVHRMLPKNKLRKLWMNNLEIFAGEDKEK